jgi:hypothetical protein
LALASSAMPRNRILCPVDSSPRPVEFSDGMRVFEAESMVLLHKPSFLFAHRTVPIAARQPSNLTGNLCRPGLGPDAATQFQVVVHLFLSSQLYQSSSPGLECGEASARTTATRAG